MVTTTRERILDTAVELFAARGYDGTPTASIAKQASIPKGLVFHYFPTKIDLLVAIVTERAHVDRLRTLPIEPVTGDVAQTLLRLATRLRDSLHVSPALRRIIFREAYLHPQVSRCLTQLHTEVFRGVRRAIDAALDGQQDRKVAGAQRDAAAAAFASALLHDLNLRQLTSDMLDIGAIAALIARGLQSPQPAGA